MPRRQGEVANLHELAALERIALNGSWQHHWYRHIGAWLAENYDSDVAVIDVGSGDGSGLMHLLAAGLDTIRAIDLGPSSNHVERQAVEDVATRSADFVLAIDVLEHVEDDRAFLRQLARIARTGVFITTPNWNRFHASNRFHVREYTPLELQAILAAELPGRRLAWTSGDFCEIETRSWPFHDDEPAANFGILTECKRGRTS